MTPGIVGLNWENDCVSRFRLYPTLQQAAALAEHCAHARYVWNLAVEQLGYRSWGQRMPGYAEQNQQLTEARRAFDWLGAGSVTVQQQALRDFHQSMSNWRAGTHRRPAWRKRGRNEGFRIVGAPAHRVEQLNRRWSRVLWPP